MTTLPEARIVAEFLHARYDEEDRRLQQLTTRQQWCGTAEPGSNAWRATADLDTKRRILTAALEVVEHDECDVVDRSLALRILDLLTRPYRDDARRRHPSGRHPEEAPEEAADTGQADVVPLQRTRSTRPTPRRRRGSDDKLSPRSALPR